VVAIEKGKHRGLPLQHRATTWGCPYIFILQNQINCVVPPSCGLLFEHNLLILKKLPKCGTTNISEKINSSLHLFLKFFIISIFDKLCKKMLK